MKLFRGPLHRLKTHAFDGDLDITQSPLGQKVDRPKSTAKAVLAKARNRHVAGEHNRLPHTKLISNLATGDAPLGYSVHDWAERPFELCQTTCELRYQSHRRVHDDVAHPSGIAGMVSIGFIQSHTVVIAGPVVESFDRNLDTGEKLSIHTIELGLQIGNAIYPKFVILGHALESERDRWLRAMQHLISNKVVLQQGWRQFYEHSIMSDADKTEAWLKNRSGQDHVHMNAIARRKARLQNGKVLQDVPKVFEKYSEECPDWPVQLTVEGARVYGAAIPHVMDASHIVEALAELGLELAPKIAKRVLDEVHKSPPCPDMPDAIDLQRFELIFRSCCLEFLVSPSEEMKQSLMRIMKDSKNPFLKLLSPSEQKYLIEGKDADGRYFCTCKNYVKDTVLVQQGDEGDSMFIIIEGSLSVVVTFGAGSATVQKEVAVLPAGSVMGEMSLVLGKPRSATCVVKSESASVAEISKTAMFKLLDARPSLARELEDMVYRRDAANYLNAGKTADAMAAYRQRGTAAAGHAVATTADAGNRGRLGSAPPHGPGMPGVGAAAGAGPAGTGYRSASRIQSRQSKLPPRRAQTSHGALPPVHGPGLPYRTAADAAEGLGPRVKSGRWVKCRGIYVFVVD